MDCLTLENFVGLLGPEFGERSFLDKLETTAENSGYIKKGRNIYFFDSTDYLPEPFEPETPVFKFDSLQFAQLFAARKLEQTETIKRRANSKALSQKLAFALYGLNSDLQTAYGRTFFCASFITEEQGRFKSKYCHNRWCLVCGRIKTAKYIRLYTPIIEKMKNARFVTLTHKNCSRDKLPQTLDKMYKDWRKITDLMRKRKKPLQGTRKLECTYNRDTNEYHPHFHIVVNGESNANAILDEWIRLDKANRTRAAQDEKPADNGSLKELFKYFTKLTTNSSKDPKLSIPAINYIFEVIKGKRVFQSFGIKLPKDILSVKDKNFDELISEYSTKVQKQKILRDLLPDETANAYFWDERLSNWVHSNAADLLVSNRKTDNIKNFEMNFEY